MQQDSDATRKDIKELSLRIEELERQKSALEAKVNTPTTSYATKDELKLLEARINEKIETQSKRVEAEILEAIKEAKKNSSVTTVIPSSTAATSISGVSKPEVKTSTKTEKAETVSKPAKIEISEEEKQNYTKEGIRYTVQAGDSLTSIAKKYHSSVRAIMAVNEISSPNKLFVGKELFVPTISK